jgi:hypothetical protein
MFLLRGHYIFHLQLHFTHYLYLQEKYSNIIKELSNIRKVLLFNLLNWFFLQYLRNRYRTPGWERGVIKRGTARTIDMCFFRRDLGSPRLKCLRTPPLYNHHFYIAWKKGQLLKGVLNEACFYLSISMV